MRGVVVTYGGWRNWTLEVSRFASMIAPVGCENSEGRGGMHTDEDFESRRRQMVERQIASRGVDDERVLDAMRSVPRHEFVPQRHESMAYEDRPLPIGEAQTISQPYIVALMTEMAEIDPENRVLEVGAGSGYGAAVSAEFADEVFTIERHAELAEEARDRLEELGYDNVEVVIGDGTVGLPDEAPFDAIIATASGPELPESFKGQLAVHGTIVMPVGSRRGGQRLVKWTKREDGTFAEDDEGFVRFVPLIGSQAWSDDESTGASKPSSNSPFEF